MDIIIKNIVGGIIFVIMGLLGAVFHKQWARGTIEFSEKYPLFQISDLSSGVKSRENVEKQLGIQYLLVSIVCVIFGLLSLFQIIKFK